MVFDWPQTRIPVVVTLGGGYSDPIEQQLQAHVNTFRTAISVTRRSATFPHSLSVFRVVRVLAIGPREYGFLGA